MSYTDGQLAKTFIKIADVLVDDFDVVDVLSTIAEHCAQLLGAPEVGLMLADSDGVLQVIGSLSTRMQGIELFEIQNAEGPCLDSFKTGEKVLNQDLNGEADEKWPHFAGEARQAGFKVVHALPMRLRKSMIGALNIFNDEDHHLSEEEVEIAQALADAATIAILQDRALRQATLVAKELEYALESRVVIEQAKGFLSQRTGGDVRSSFEALRGYARSHNRRIAEVSRDIVGRKLDLADVFDKPNS